MKGMQISHLCLEIEREGKKREECIFISFVWIAIGKEMKKEKCIFFNTFMPI